MNVIDRHDNYCKENSHTKLLSSKHNFWKNSEKDNVPIYFTDLGIPGQLYDQIIEKTARFRKGWYDEDFVINKDRKNKKYDVYDGSDKKYISEESVKLANLEALTDSEKAYEKYDLDKIFPTTTYTKLLKKVPNLFKAVDAVCNTNYYDILEHLASEEKKKWDENRAANKPAVSTAPKPEESESFVKRQVQESKEEFKVVNSEGLTLEEQCAKNFKSWGKLGDKDKSTIISIIENFNEKGVPKFKKGITTMPCSDETCHFADGVTVTSFPQEVGQCAVCGVKYE
jgi:hypothetical protein